MPEQTIFFKTDWKFQVEGIILQQSWFSWADSLSWSCWSHGAGMLCGCRGSDGGKFQVRTEMLWWSRLEQPACSLLALHNVDCSLYLLGATPRGGNTQGSGGERRSDAWWKMPAPVGHGEGKLSTPILKPWEIAGLPSVLKQDGHRNIKPKPVFTGTFPWQQLLSSVKPPELMIKLWAAHVLMSQMSQSSDRLMD